MTSPEVVVRPRPALTPRSVTCPSCGATLLERSDATRFVVCRYCSAHLELDVVEARVLAKGEQRAGFDYEIDDVFLWDGIRYVVAARMVFRQDDDGSVSETVEYLLFSPRRGTLYLDKDDGQWLLSRMVHVMPRTADPFSLREGAQMETCDGQSWTFRESGTGRLVYVDGSLPWVARVGDRVEYATFFGAADSSRGYEVERDSGETEFCQFRVVPSGELDQAWQTKRKERHESHEPVRETGPVRSADDAPTYPHPSSDDKSATRTWLLLMAVVSFFFTIVNLALASNAATEGTIVLDRTIPPGYRPPPPPPPTALDAGAATEDDEKSDAGGDAADDDKGVLSDEDNSPPDPEEVPVIGGVEFATESFVLKKNTALLIDLSAPAIREAWASVDVALVQDEDSATHILDAELSHYDDDDDPAGQREEKLYAWIEEAGTYHLLLRVMGGTGESEKPADLPAALNVRAVSKTRIQTPFQSMAIVSSVLGALFLAVFFFSRSREKKEAEEDE